ncbi:MAG: DNA polymerase III subunit beta, partial [Proteobacteria bacterium]|nr:DNA polymerase III subunit beta [Pseudomonadota bacterium]
MKFEISKSSLVKALSNVNGAVEKRNTIPILLNVKIEAVAGKLKLVTTDMDIVVASIADAKVESEGETTVPAQLFYDIVRKIPDGTNIHVELPSDSSSIKIKYNKSKFSLPCLGSEEFPILSEGEILVKFNIESEELIRVIDKTRFAISNDETRHYLNGLFLHALKKDDKVELRAVATDGHRLALASCNISNVASDVKGVIIPRKTTNEI